MTGILAGITASVGATAPLVMLEHPRGYSYAYCFEELKLDRLDAGLGEKWEILKNVPKSYPSLTASRPPIEAVLTLKKSMALNRKIS